MLERKSDGSVSFWSSGRYIAACSGALVISSLLSLMGLISMALFSPNIVSIDLIQMSLVLVSQVCTLFAATIVWRLKSNPAIHLYQSMCSLVQVVLWTQLLSILYYAFRHRSLVVGTMCCLPGLALSMYQMGVHPRVDSEEKAIQMAWKVQVVAWIMGMTEAMQRICLHSSFEIAHEISTIVMVGFGIFLFWKHWRPLGQVQGHLGDELHAMYWMYSVLSVLLLVSASSLVLQHCCIASLIASLSKSFQSNQGEKRRFENETVFTKRD